MIKIEKLLIIKVTKLYLFCLEDKGIKISTDKERQDLTADKVKVKIKSFTSAYTILDFVEAKEGK